MDDAVWALPFMQRAAAAVTLAAVVLGALSGLVVQRRLAFFSAAIAQSALTGVALAVWLGEPLDAPWASVFGFSLTVGVLLVFVKRHSTLPVDTVVGVALALTLGLGVCLLVAVTKRFNVHQLESVMFGSVLTVGDGDLALLGSVGLAVLLVTGWHFNALLLDEAAAASSGVDAARLEYLFVVLLTLATVVCLKVMGALMVEALVVVPAAAARLVAGSARTVVLLSTAIAVVSGLGGVYVSSQVAVPSGAAVVLVLGGLFALLFITSLLKPARHR